MSNLNLIIALLVEHINLQQKPLLFKISIGWILLFVIICCTHESDQPSPSGEKLAQQYCGGCHSFPDPAGLPKDTWERTILTRMGNRLGIYSAEYSRAAALALDVVNAGKDLDGIYPPEPLITQEAWKAIQTYYIDNAPKQLNLTEAATSGTVDYFKPLFPNAFFSPPSGTMLKLLPDQQGVIYGDANKKALVAFDESLKLTAQFRVGEGPTSYCAIGDQAYFSVIGSFSPTDAPLGSVWEVTKTGKARPIIQQLRRPTDVQAVDLFSNGQTALVIPEYGKEFGQLAYWTKQSEDWIPTVIAKRPGCIKSIPLDINGDDRLDLLSLFGQGDEKIMAYLQEGDGSFVAKTILSLPPYFGSSALDTVDWNQDGLTDIIYTAGDNADYKPILKPYHGIYIYEQQSSGGFEWVQFLPLPGAYAAEVADFDLDGDLDIVAISFFSDFNLEFPQSLVFFKQLEKGRFGRLAFPASNSGRWLRLSAEDYDGDGDIDVAAASLAFETVPDRGQVADWVKGGLPFVLWENTTR